MEPHDEALVNMHKAFLEALRHREQEILRFVAILGTALGGFVWILGAEGLQEPARFAAGTYGVLLVLVVGAFYALALGYNYRYLTLQLAKLESHLNLKTKVLAHWPREIADFEKKSRWGVVPWCTPPGIIKVFWVAFLASILVVTAAASVARDEIVWAKSPAGAATPQVSQPEPASGKLGESKRRERWMPLLQPIPYAGAACFLLSLLGPVHVGRKMLRACERERPEEWNARDHQASDNKPPQEDEHGRHAQDKC